MKINFLFKLQLLLVDTPYCLWFVSSFVQVDLVIIKVKKFQATGELSKWRDKPMRETSERRKTYKRRRWYYVVSYALYVDISCYNLQTIPPTPGWYHVISYTLYIDVPCYIIHTISPTNEHSHDKANQATQMCGRWYHYQ